MLTKFDGSALDTKPAGVKVRLSAVYKRPDQGMKDIMDELRALTEQDLADFRGWFEAAGFPCTTTVAG